MKFCRKSGFEHECMHVFNKFGFLTTTKEIDATFQFERNLIKSCTANFSDYIPLPKPGFSPKKLENTPKMLETWQVSKWKVVEPNIDIMKNDETSDLGENGKQIKEWKKIVSREVRPRIICISFSRADVFTYRFLKKHNLDSFWQRKPMFQIVSYTRRILMSSNKWSLPYFLEKTGLASFRYQV